MPKNQPTLTKLANLGLVGSATGVVAGKVTMLNWFLLSKDSKGHSKEAVVTISA